MLLLLNQDTSGQKSDNFQIRFLYYCRLYTSLGYEIFSWCNAAIRMRYVAVRTNAIPILQYTTRLGFLHWLQ